VILQADNHGFSCSGCVQGKGCAQGKVRFTVNDAVPEHAQISPRDSDRSARLMRFAGCAALMLRWSGASTKVSTRQLAASGRRNAARASIVLKVH